MVACICFIVYRIVHCLSTCKACDPASDWSLVIEFHVVLLVACRIACRTVLLHVLFQLSRVIVQATGRLLLVPIQMYWSLAWSLKQSQGSAGKVLSWESQIQLHQATGASAWSLAIVFNGNQGGRLSHCHCRMCTCIFSLVFSFTTCPIILTVTRVLKCLCF